MVSFFHHHKVATLVTILATTFLLANAGCSDDGAATGGNIEDTDAGPLTDIENPEDGIQDQDTDEPCLNPADCDEFYYCKSDADCDFLLADLPECSTAICETNTNTCSVHEDPTPGCKEEKPENTICEVIGAAGETVTCPIEVVRTHSDVPGPTFLTGDVHYPSSLITFVGFSDRPCDDENCDALAVPPGTLYPTGHTLAINPAAVESWDGVGVFSISPPQDDEYAYMSEAYFGATGTVAGESQVVDVQFRLNIPILTPVYITLSNPTAQGLPESSLYAEVVDHQVIVDGAAVEIPCDPETDPECVEVTPPEDLICSLSGAEGAQVECPISLVRASAQSAHPTSLLGKLDYDPARLTLVGFVQGTTAIPPGMLATGHTLATNPAAPSGWNGAVTVSIQSPTLAGPAALTDLYLLGENPIADPTLVKALFTLNTSTSLTNPAYVGLSGVSSKGGEGIPLITSVENLLVVVDGEEQCPFKPDCVIEPTPVEAPDGFICSLSGAAGDEAICPLWLVREDMNAPLVTALQFVMTYDTQIVSVTGFTDELCVDGVGCFEVPVTGAGSQPLSSGHIVAVAPLDPAEWDGSVACIIAFGITEGITEAYLGDNGNIVGDPAYMNVHLSFNKDVDLETPVHLGFSDLLGSSAAAQSLPIVINNGMMISSGP